MEVALNDHIPLRGTLYEIQEKGMYTMKCIVGHSDLLMGLQLDRSKGRGSHRERVDGPLQRDHPQLPGVLLES